jgi:hypothetical protein
MASDVDLSMKEIRGLEFEMAASHVKPGSSWDVLDKKLIHVADGVIIGIPAVNDAA